MEPTYDVFEGDTGYCLATNVYGDTARHYAEAYYPEPIITPHDSGMQAYREGRYAGGTGSEIDRDASSAWLQGWYEGRKQYLS